MRRAGFTSRAAQASLALAAVVMALASGVAVAHVPDLERGADGGPMAIEGPEASRAIYGHLAPGEKYDAYAFHVDEPVTRTIGVIVPSRTEHAGFRPSLRLLADGIETALIEDPGLDEREAEWEPFSLTDFWTGGEQRIAFEPGVEYELRVEPGTGPDGSGRYVIVFGGPEAFTPADSARTLVYLPVIWFGAYGDAPAHWNWWALVPLAVVAAVLVSLVRAVVRAVRRRHATRQTELG
ncbi:MAG: hypothetical protein P1P71_09975 [Anaerosomatales bacterium]|nr:hypothetical protein [Anaerosomatales bacterium]